MDTSLQSVFIRFAREVQTLRFIFTEQTHGGFHLSPISTAAQSYAIFRLHDSWGRYCRNLVLTSAHGRVSSITGMNLRPSPLLSSQIGALEALKGTYPPARQGQQIWEPRWFNPTEAIDAAERLRVSNFASISAGLGSSGDAPEQLRRCRNFLAHRSQLTNRAVDSLRTNVGVSARVRVEEIANAIVFGGASLFDSWCHELLSKAHAAAW